MRSVCKRLSSETRRAPGGAIRFLEAALTASTIWHERGCGFVDRSDALARLAHACTAAVSALTTERKMATYVLAFDASRKDPSYGALECADDPAIKNPAYMEPAQERFNQVLAHVTLIADWAAHGCDYHPVDLPLPTARKFDQQEEIFCIKVLLRAAKEAFDKPLLQEVADTIAVLFDKDGDQRSRVQELWNSMPDKQGFPM
jgi:RES domain-containing protein